MPNTSYLAVFLTPESKATLLRKLVPMHDKVYGEHLTLALKKDLLPLDKYPMGKTVTLIATHHTVDWKAQAVLVQLPTELSGKCASGIPHITISCLKWVKPAYSKDLLAPTSNAPLMLLHTPITLTGVVRFPE